MPGTAYLIAEGYAADLHAELAELGAVEPIAERLFYHDGPPRPAAWAADVWYGAERIPFTSIGTAAAQLRQRGGWWCHLPSQEQRRGELIAEALPRLKIPALDLPPAKRLRSLSAYTLLGRNELLAASRTQRPFPLGVASLIEDHDAPPSRAYRKMREALLLLGRWPQAQDPCWDLGASPGAWTWELARRGVPVLAVDKAPLAERVAAMPGVSYRQGSAFAMDPTADPVSWICSDVICYPARLLEHVQRWLAAGVENFVVTVKFQGGPDPASVRAFQALPSSRVLHLHHNKHEVTWLRHPCLAMADGTCLVNPDSGLRSSACAADPPPAPTGPR